MDAKLADGLDQSRGVAAIDARERITVDRLGHVTSLGSVSARVEQGWGDRGQTVQASGIHGGWGEHGRHSRSGAHHRRNTAGYRGITAGRVKRQALMPADS